jgi:hypothetical protein
MAALNFVPKIIAGSVLALFTLASVSCGGGTMSSCNISTSLMPMSATADHTAAAPGNQVTFAVSSKVSGVCPMTPDSIGTWSTSDPNDVSLTNISAQMANTITATCVNATANSASIKNSGTVRGKTFPAATLSCK